MSIFRKAVTACAVAGAGLVLAVVPAGSALASTGTTVGQAGPPLEGNTFESGEWVQTAAAMPVGGTVTSLNTQAASSCPGGGGSYNLQVLRPLGNNQYKVLGDTGNQTDPCDGNLHSYPVSIPVQAGDVIGAFAGPSWRGLLSVTSGTVNAAGNIAEPAVGDTVTVPFTQSITMDESATLVPDTSGLAAKLVSDTDHLKPGTALVDQATAIQTAVTAGQTVTACTDITDFLGLVKAQTGKKLSHANAMLLTTDANNLATALNC